MSGERYGACKQRQRTQPDWRAFYSEIESLQVWELPGDSHHPEHRPVLDGITIVVELRDGDRFRSYKYGNPHSQSYLEAEDANDILRLVQSLRSEPWKPGDAAKDGLPEFCRGRRSNPKVGRFSVTPTVDEDIRPHPPCDLRKRWGRIRSSYSGSLCRMRIDGDNLVFDIMTVFSGEKNVHAHVTLGREGNAYRTASVWHADRRQGDAPMAKYCRDLKVTLSSSSADLERIAGEFQYVCQYDWETVHVSGSFTTAHQQKE
jgi:hypothetical protein